MAKMKLDFSGFSEYLKKIEQAGGCAREAADKALKASFDVVTPAAAAAMAKSNLPAKGEYSTGRTLEALRTEPVIKWSGDIAECSVGFDLKQGGLASIFLMYGTPRMRPDKKLYDAFYSKATERAIKEAQEGAFFEELHKSMGI